MEIVLTWDVIIKAGAVLAAVTAIITALVKFIHWVDAQKKQTSDIADLRHRHDDDIKVIQTEQTLLVYDILACLKGLKEQGCNGPVTEAINKIEKHLNQEAHRCKEEKAS